MRQEWPLQRTVLPRGEVGFELFDKVKFGMSDLAQKVNYRRALQGELSKNYCTIGWSRVGKGSDCDT